MTVYRIPFEDIEHMLRNKWGVEISPFQKEGEIEVAATRGYWWIKCSYPLMVGKLELYDRELTRVKGICQITDRETLRQIIMSTDGELEAHYVVPPPIKEGTEKKPVPPKEESDAEKVTQDPVTEKPVNAADVTGVAETS